MLFLDHFRHIENKHEKVKKGECSRCHRQFGTKSSAERHEREQKCTEETQIFMFCYESYTRRIRINTCVMFSKIPMYVQRYYIQNLILVPFERFETVLAFLFKTKQVIQITRLKTGLTEPGVQLILTDQLTLISTGGRLYPPHYYCPLPGFLGLPTPWVE